MSSVVKRGLDLAGTLALAVMAAPVLLLAALTVRITMGSPVFFRQARVGRDGRLFTLVKLRTMRAPAAGEDALASDHARLTPLGRRLRATSIDELPELWNVLRGDMSLVGPRPLLPEYLPRYTPEQARRHDVRPGLTGLAQVRGRNALDWPERLALDVWYVDHQSLALDLSILLRTLLAVLRRDGIAAADHATMPEFQGVRR
ncbi:MAG: sugar transferase [Deltaproteobacteria bacterium]|nr:sugar transferase [Deltaproteobacteria bacterium]